MKRKVITGLITAAMMTVMAIPAYAANQQSGTTNINATVDSEYMLTIPAETTIAFEAELTKLGGPLKVTGNVLPDQTVTVTATANPLANAAQGTALAYTLMNGTGEFTSDSWNEDELRSASKEIQLSVAIDKADWDNAEAGKYEGSIVFNAELK